MSLLHVHIMFAVFFPFFFFYLASLFVLSGVANVFFLVVSLTFITSDSLSVRLLRIYIYIYMTALVWSPTSLPVIIIVGL